MVCVLYKHTNRTNGLLFSILSVCYVCRSDAVFHESPALGRCQLPPLCPVQTLGGREPP